MLLGEVVDVGNEEDILEGEEVQGKRTSVFKVGLKRVACFTNSKNVPL